MLSLTIVMRIVEEVLNYVMRSSTGTVSVGPAALWQCSVAVLENDEALHDNIRALQAGLQCGRFGG